MNILASYTQRINRGLQEDSTAFGSQMGLLFPFPIVSVVVVIQTCLSRAVYSSVSSLTLDDSEQA